MLRRSRFLTGPLALFDLGLAILAVGFPRYYMGLMHTAGDAEFFLLQRTGMIWLCFAAAEAVAYHWPERFPQAIFLVGAFRLMDALADVAYFFTSQDLTTLGHFFLIFGPVFNTIVGVYLVRLYRRYELELRGAPA
jgi:hypothetical protein